MIDNVTVTNKNGQQMDVESFLKQGECKEIYFDDQKKYRGILSHAKPRNFQRYDREPGQLKSWEKIMDEKLQEAIDQRKVEMIEISKSNLAISEKRKLLYIGYLSLLSAENKIDYHFERTSSVVAHVLKTYGVKPNANIYEVMFYLNKPEKDIHFFVKRNQKLYGVHQCLIYPHLRELLSLCYSPTKKTTNTLRDVWTKYPAIAGFLLSNDTIKYKDLSSDIIAQMKREGVDLSKYEKPEAQPEKPVEIKEDEKSEQSMIEVKTVESVNAENIIEETKPDKPSGVKFNIAIGRLNIKGDIEFY